MQQAINLRGRLPLRQWIEETWLALLGPACLQHKSQLQDADMFFSCLEECDEGGDVPDIEKLEEQLDRLYAAADNKPNVQVEIMTIHKSKGLEFDTVILPGLGRSAAKNTAQLLLWEERTRAHWIVVTTNDFR